MEKESSRVCRGKNIGKKKNGMVTIEAQGTAAVRQAPISLSRMDVKEWYGHNRSSRNCCCSASADIFVENGCQMT
jgi:hypothetical protein